MPIGPVSFSLKKKKSETTPLAYSLYHKIQFSLALEVVLPVIVLSALPALKRRGFIHVFIIAHWVSIPFQTFFNCIMVALRECALSGKMIIHNIPLFKLTDLQRRFLTRLRPLNLLKPEEDNMA